MCPVFTMSRHLMVVFLLLPIIVSSEIIDLTWDYAPDTQNWPSASKFSYTKEIGNSYERGYWYAVSEFCMNEHVGTHLDSPYHFHETGWKVAEIPLDRLITNGTVINLNTTEQNATLLPRHLDEWVAQHGAFDQNTVVLVRFGWSRYWNDRHKYFGWNDTTFNTQNMNFPGLSPEAAQWIADNGNIVGVGLDTPSVDPGSSTDYQVHRILAKNGIYGLEHVKLIDELPARNFTLLVVPMKIRYGTGAPTRILAVPNGL